MPIEMAGLWTPSVASTTAGDVDWLFYFIYYSCVIAFVAIMVPMFYFVWAYRRKSEGQKATSQVDHSLFIEVSWSSLPLIYFILVFAWGFHGFLDMFVAPEGAKELRVIGQKWMWTVQYPDDGVEVSGQGAQVVVPVGKPVKLVMASQDVIHSFFIPNFRTKQDVIPGRYTTLWFNSDKVGEYPVFCAEYCGTDHSVMMAQVKVVSDADFAAWVKKKQEADNSLSPKELGAKLYKAKGCNACHTIDGSPKAAPSFKGLYGKDETMNDGKTVKVDDNYIRESILNPQAKIVKGFGPVMPTYEGQLNEKQLGGLIEYIKTLK